MKRLKIIKVISLFLCVLLLTACGEGVVLDENEIIEGNGTAELIKEGVPYKYESGVITKNGETIAELTSPKDDKLFALGQYLYANTEDGAMQIRISDGKVKKFGAGDIVAAKGKWIYYKSDKSKVRGMSLYKIDMKEGREVLLFEGNVVDVMEEDDVFAFVTDDKRIFSNVLSEDAAEEADYNLVLKENE